MDQALFQRFRDLAYRQAGIDLRDGKESLVSARVAKRLRALGIASEREYLERLESDEKGEELVQFLDVISTNFTSFFRENDHFDLIAELVAGWMREGQRRFRFWSAASSTGEEPYSLAMVLAETFGDRSIDWRILATDISTSVLAQARAGAYPAHVAERVPARLRTRWMVESQGIHHVRPELKERLTFARLNLASPPFPLQGPLDLVLCRNVMIYFDRQIRQRLVGQLERLLKPGGYLITGHSETLNGLETSLSMRRPSIYQKPWAD